MKRLTGVAFVGLLVFSGCSDPANKLAEVTGTVTGPDGQPLEGVQVMFAPDPNKETTGKASTALTDAQGKFQLKHADGEMGAVVGWHKVTVTDPKAEETARREQGERQTAPPPESRVPANYGQLGKTPLSKEVPSGGGDIPIKIDG